MQIHIDRQGQRFGPYPLEQVSQYLASGNLLPTDQAWYEGAPGWMPITQVPGVTAPAFAAAHSQMESMAIGALGVGVLSLLLGGVTYWAGEVLMIITFVLGVVGLALGIIGIVRIKNGLGDRRGKGLAISGAVISPLAVVLAILLNPGSSGGKSGSKDDGKGRAGGGVGLSGFGSMAARANRVKCVNNAKQVVGALQAFAHDNKNRFPWLLSWRDQVAAQGGPSTANARTFYETSTLFAQAGVKSGFGGSQKILVSPCDPDNQGKNDLVDLSEFHHATNPIPNDAHSYGVVTGSGWMGGDPNPETTNRAELMRIPEDKGADLLKPTTVLIVTRNINDEALSNAPVGNPATGAVGQAATWLGGDDRDNATDPRVMAGLNTNQGQAAGADGSGWLSNNADLSQKARAHNNAMGGNYKGVPSPVLDTPND